MSAMLSLPRTSLLSALLVVGMQSAGAQSPGGALRGPDVPPARYAVIDDELFDIATSADGSAGRLKPHGATVDSNALTGNAKFSGWEAGVLPIEFDATVSTARRDQFMQI